MKKKKRRMNKFNPKTENREKTEEKKMDLLTLVK